MIKIRLIAILMLIVSLSIISMGVVPKCENILLVVYRCGGDDKYYSPTLGDILEAEGYTVNEIIDPADGTMANFLLNPKTPYSQVWVWDIASGKCLDDQSDLDAYYFWYSAHPSIVIDTRSYALCCGMKATPDVNLVKNIAETFRTRGGGLYIGVDHDGYNTDGNALLNRLGYNVTSGFYTSKITGGDKTSPILTTPNAIEPSTLWVGSVSVAPTGVQPNSKELKPIVWSGSYNYISAFLLPIP